jgi:uncharacterized membrane protein
MNTMNSMFDTLRCYNEMGTVIELVGLGGFILGAVLSGATIWLCIWWRHK